MLRRPLRNLGWLLGSRSANAALSLVYLALATRSLGLQDFGRFALIVVMAQAVTGIASFSAWQAVVQWGARPGMGAAAAGFAVALDGLSIGVGSPVALLVVWSSPGWLPIPADLRGAALSLCLAALLSVRSTPTGMLRLHDRYDLAAAAEAVQPATRAAGAVAAALFWPTVGGFVCAWALAELACAAAYWLFALRVQPVRFSDLSLTRLPLREPGAWRFVWATSLSRSLAVTSKQIVFLLVGALGGPAIAGGFRVASQLGQALVQLGEAIARALYPELIRDHASAGGLAWRMAMLALVTGAIAVTFAAALGSGIIQAIAGPAYAFARDAMIVLALAGAIELIAASADALLVSRGRAMTVFALRAVPLAGALALLPSAVERMGLGGAAACVLLASWATAIGLGYMASGRSVRR